MESDDLLVLDESFPFLHLPLHDVLLVIVGSRTELGYEIADTLMELRTLELSSGRAKELVLDRLCNCAESPRKRIRSRTGLRLPI